MGQIEEHDVLSVEAGKVLSEYPEAKLSSDQQNSSLGETYSELVKRLDEGHVQL